jgi:nucleotide-binding universal stress UspA family protein
MAQAPILVPLGESSAGFEALALAGALARLRKTTVYAIHVIEVARALPLNAEMEFEARLGEQLLRRAEEAARKGEFLLQRALLQSRQAGQAIVDEAHTQHAGTIILGVEAPSSPDDDALGETASYVVKHARCQVIVVREAARE